MVLLDVPLERPQLALPVALLDVPLERELPRLERNLLRLERELLRFVDWNKPGKKLMSFFFAGNSVQ